MLTQSVVMEDVSAVLKSHFEWDAGPRARAVEVLQYLPQLVPPGQDTLPAYTETSVISSWRIELSLVFCLMLRDVGGLRGEKSLRSLSLSQDA